jgi:hypothetical protein
MADTPSDQKLQDPRRRQLPNLRAQPARWGRPAPRRADFEIFEITEADLHPTQYWRVGWFWWSYENPGEGVAEYDGLPSMFRGPYKTKKKAQQAVEVAAAS